MIPDTPFFLIFFLKIKFSENSISSPSTINNKFCLLLKKGFLSNKILFTILLLKFVIDNRFPNFLNAYFFAIFVIIFISSSFKYLKNL